MFFASFFCTFATSFGSAQPALVLENANLRYGLFVIFVSALLPWLLISVVIINKLTKLTDMHDKEMPRYAKREREREKKKTFL